MNPVDVLIIGAGPAGLSAALGLARLCRSVMVFDSQEYGDDATLAMNNVPTFDGTDPAIFRTKCINEIESKYPNVQFVDQKIIDAIIERSESGHPVIRIKDGKGHEWDGRKLLLATGCTDVLPQIEGFKECWGRQIYRSLLYDGYERRSQPIGFLEPQSVDNFAQIYMSFAMTSEQIVIFTNNQPPSSAEVEHEMKRAKLRGCRFNAKRIRSVSQCTSENGLEVIFHDGSSEKLGFMLVYPKTKFRAQNLMGSLGIENQPETDFESGRRPFGRTNVKSCFMAGDNVTSTKAVLVAASTGVLTALEIAKELAFDDTNRVVEAEVSSMWSM